MVVNDEPIVRLVIKSVLTENLGLTDVQEAEDGVEAVEIALDTKRPPFDLVVMDLNMPRMGGM